MWVKFEKKISFVAWVQFYRVNNFNNQTIYKIILILPFEFVRSQPFIINKLPTHTTLRKYYAKEKATKFNRKWNIWASYEIEIYISRRIKPEHRVCSGKFLFSLLNKLLMHIMLGVVKLFQCTIVSD